MKKIILLSLLLMFQWQISLATHIVGADISYQCLGNNEYEFTLKAYRDCDGIPVQPTYRLDYLSLSCNFQGTITVRLAEDRKDISPVCPTEASTCFGGTQPGIQQYVYKGTFTFPAQCTDWVISWRECNRNAAITNIEQPSNECLYIEATLNNVAAACNNSPAFNNPPVSFICMNQPNPYNPGTVERDGDRLVFKAITPRAGRFTTVQYKPGFSASNPISSNPAFSINPNSGDIAISPTAPQVTVTAILVEEWRDGVLIGSIMRDIQIISRNCDNDNPVLSGINNTLSDSIEVCAGDKLCFFINGSDPNPGQNLTMTWNQGIDTTRATFTVGGTSTNPRGDFCWQTNASDRGQYMFTVTATDDFCPIVGNATRSYKIRVNAPPVISMPASVTIACNETANINPTVTGSAPFTYRWNTGETTQSISKGSGNYTVTVTDSKGCVSRRTINIRNGLNANFTEEKLCVGDLTQFTDLSTSDVTTIESWQWDFGDPESGPANNSSTLQNPTHQYNTNKTYFVTLTIRDDANCEASVRKPVTICDIPKPNFRHLDSCQQKTLPLRDLTLVDNCGLSNILINWGDGSTSSRNFNPPAFPNQNITNTHNYGSSGYFDIKYTVTNQSGCKDSITKTIFVNPRPTINIIEENHVFRCDKPDTLLTTSHFGDNPPFSIRWNTGNTGPTLATNQPGTYIATVTDRLGCVHSDNIHIKDPLIVRFTTDPYCFDTDPVNFINQSLSDWGISNWEWTFGDGTSSTLQNPVPVQYAEQGIYVATLTARDNSNCEKTFTKNINYVFPDDIFDIQPNPICLEQVLNLTGPRGQFIDSLVWDLGNGALLSAAKNHKNEYGSREIFTDANGKRFFDPTYRYTGADDPGKTYNIKLRMYYNDYTCHLDYDRDLSIFPKFDIDITSEGFCAGEETTLNGIQNAGSPVTSWDWKIYYDDFNHHKHDDPSDHHGNQGTGNHHHFIEVGDSDVQNPVFTFPHGGNYYADLIATNQDGCVFKYDNHAFSIVELPEPVFCIEDPCVTQRTKFFYFCTIFPEVVIDSIHWSFGDGNTTNVTEPFNIFPEADTYDVTCEIFNTSFGCKNEYTKQVKIYPLPEPKFEADNQCFGQAITFEDQSTAEEGELTSWHWNFGDGNFSTEQNPTHIYENPGLYPITLTTTVSNTVIENGEPIVYNCTDTLATRTVQVYQNPVADFTADLKGITAQRPIQFFDESLYADKWFWTFGDGDSLWIYDPNLSSPLHTYEKASKDITVTQVAFNEFNCSDTATLNLNLNIYLLLPNAFSPNGDGNNDFLNLTYRGIEELLVFRVYNRWGQLIFDGGTDLEAYWDGTYQGKDQPIGAYVYYVKGRSYLKEEIILSGNLTLIR